MGMTTKELKCRRDRERYLKQDYLTPREAAIVLGCTEGEVERRIVEMANAHSIKSKFQYRSQFRQYAYEFVDMIVESQSNRTYFNGASLSDFLKACGKL